VSPSRLTPGRPPSRHARLRPVSRAKRKQGRQRAACLAAVRERSGGRCELKVPGVCTTWGTEGHEPAKRSHGADITNPAEVLWSCPACHAWAHANPKAACAMGILIQKKDQQ
jgi:hypothetical protein